MINCFYKVYTVTIKGIEYQHASNLIISDESKISDEDLEVTFGWDSLDDIYEMFGLVMPFNVWNMKKGRLISFFNAFSIFDKRTWDIKEWKEPLEITLKVTHKEYNTVSINDILKYHDHKLAIQYLSQEGLNCIQ